MLAPAALVEPVPALKAAVLSGVDRMLGQAWLIGRVGLGRLVGGGREWEERGRGWGGAFVLSSTTSGSSSGSQAAQNRQQVFRRLE